MWTMKSDTWAQREQSQNWGGIAAITAYHIPVTFQLSLGFQFLSLEVIAQHTTQPNLFMLKIITDPESYQYGKQLI